MLEKQIEKYLCDQVKKLGGIPYKFTSPQRRSVPDRLCVFPEGVLVFVEVKATGKEPTDAQYRELDRLKDLGHWATWAASKGEVNMLVSKVKMMIEGRR